MRIKSVIALGLAIIVVKFLMPTLFAGFQNMLLAFFNTMQSILTVGSNGLLAKPPF